MKFPTWLFAGFFFGLFEYTFWFTFRALYEYQYIFLLTAFPVSVVFFGLFVMFTGKYVKELIVLEGVKYVEKY